MSAVQTDAAASARRTPTWLVATIAGLFGLFYAYAVWNAVAFLIAQASGPLGLNGLGWFVLILPVVLPILVFAGALAIGRRRTALHLLLVMLAGLTLVSVFWLDVIGYAASSGASLLG
ncbi:hypothetical protein [Microbacterium sp. P01]|uniref:hypothetical protein n=1 Tax=unclassified Microbacterium TaxID=2609290 RepID=UPI00366B6214